MTSKKIQIAFDLTTEKEWREFIQRPGLLVVDLYRDWAGPCVAMNTPLKNLKTSDTAYEWLHLANAPSSLVPDLKRLEGSRPTFVLLSGKRLVNIIFGCNAPEIIRIIKDELEREKRAARGEEKRQTVSLTKLCPGEVAMQEQLYGAEGDRLRAEHMQAELEADRLLRRILSQIADHLPNTTIVVVFPYAIRSENLADVLQPLRGSWAELGFSVTREEQVELTREAVDLMFWQRRLPQHDILVETVTQGASLVLMLERQTEDEPEDEEDEEDAGFVLDVEHVVAKSIYGFLPGTGSSMELITPVDSLTPGLAEDDLEPAELDADLEETDKGEEEGGENAAEKGDGVEEAEDVRQPSGAAEAASEAEVAAGGQGSPGEGVVGEVPEPVSEEAPDGTHDQDREKSDPEGPVGDDQDEDKAGVAEDQHHSDAGSEQRDGNKAEDKPGTGETNGAEAGAEAGAEDGAKDGAEDGAEDGSVGGEAGPEGAAEDAEETSPREQVDDDEDLIPQEPVRVWNPRELLPALNSAAARLLFRQDDGGPVLPGIWTPLDALSKAAAVKALFEDMAETLYEPPTPPPPPPPESTVICFAGDKREEVLELSSAFPSEVTRIGFFTKSRKLLASSRPDYERLVRSGLQTAKTLVVLEVTRVRSAPLLELATAGPLYISATPAIAKADVDEFFGGKATRASPDDLREIVKVQEPVEKEPVAATLSKARKPETTEQELGEEQAEGEEGEQQEEQQRPEDTVQQEQGGEGAVAPVVEQGLGDGEAVPEATEPGGVLGAEATVDGAVEATAADVAAEEQLLSGSGDGDAPPPPDEARTSLAQATEGDLAPAEE